MELLEEAKFRKPVIMYHGTSSAFLREILKKGIIPNSRNAVFDHDEEATPDAPSNRTVGGTYWTKNLLTASKHASLARQKFWGDKLYVIAQIAELSAFSDEDDVVFKINRAFSKTIKEVFGVIKDAYHVYIPILFDDKNVYRKALNTFIESVHEILGTENQPVPRNLLIELFEAHIERIYAYVGNEDTRFYDMRLGERMREIENPPEPMDMGDAERRYSIVLDKLTRHYTKFARQSDSEIGHSVRVTEPVTYRGSNRIIAIITETDKGQLLLNYGDVPMKFIEDYKRHINHNFPGIVDAETGEYVVDPE